MGRPVYRTDAAAVVIVVKAPLPPLPGWDSCLRRAGGYPVDAVSHRRSEKASSRRACRTWIPQPQPPHAALGGTERPLGDLERCMHVALRFNSVRRFRLC